MLHFLDDPGAEPDPATWELFEDGAWRSTRTAVSPGPGTPATFRIG